MTRSPLVFVASLALLVPQVVSAQAKTPTENQCREMISAMVHSMKSAPLKAERDQQRAKALIDQAEKLIRDNRAKKVSKCVTWSAVSGIVTSQ